MSDPLISEAERLQLTIIIMRLASDAARQSLEAMMHTSEYEKTFVEELRDQGKAEGHVEGKAEGLVEGEARSVLRILDARRLAPSEEQRQRVISCTDAAQLDLWLDRAITADTADEVFAD
jgi:predicted transposase YdaD